MKKTGRSTFFIVVALIALFAVSAVTGFDYYFGDNSTTVIKGVDDIRLGIDIKEQEVLLDEEIENLIEERQAARKAKNFARADEIRDLLTEKGIILEDTREGVRWKRA